jgi:hypothetical protein
MKLATYKDGSRDGQLIVVSRDLRLACYATGIASRMQQVLDDWSFMAPQLQDVSAQPSMAGSGVLSISPGVDATAMAAECDRADDAPRRG